MLLVAAPTSDVRKAPKKLCFCCFSPDSLTRLNCFSPHPLTVFHPTPSSLFRLTSPSRMHCAVHTSAPPSSWTSSCQRDLAWPISSKMLLCPCVHLLVILSAPCLHLCDGASTLILRPVMVSRLHRVSFLSCCNCSNNNIWGNMFQEWGVGRWKGSCFYR